MKLNGPRKPNRQKWSEREQLARKARQVESGSYMREWFIIFGSRQSCILTRTSDWARVNEGGVSGLSEEEREIIPHFRPPHRE
jgi:hypothetical protein